MIARRRDVLKRHPLFAELSRFALRKLRADSTIHEHLKGAVICRAGQTCESFFVILSGRCKRQLPNSKASPLTLGPGDTIGKRELLFDEVHQATVTVVTDSILLEVGIKGLGLLVERNPKLLSRITRALRPDPAQVALLGRGNKRVVSIARLGRDGAGRYLDRRLAEVLCDQSHGSVLLVNFQESPGENGAPGLNTSVSDFNGAFHFASAVRDLGKIKELNITLDGAASDPDNIPALFGHLHSHFDYVLVSLDEQTPSPMILECLRQSDRAFLYLSPDEQAIYQARLLLRELQESGSSVSANVTPVLVARDRNDLRHDLRELELRLESRQAMLLPAFSDRGTAEHLRVVGRTIARCRVGLALSAGSAKGLAHIGVIQVLEENGIDVDVVVGSSMGAYVGACWCAGHDGQALAKLAGEMNSRRKVMRLMDPVFPPRRGMIRGRSARRILLDSIGSVHFSELRRDFCVVATDLEDLSRVDIRSGLVADAVHASVAMPGVVIPVRMSNGRTYTDGAVSDPLPVAVLEEMGIEYIIAVNTMPSLEDIAERLREHNPRPEPGIFSRCAGFLNRHLNYFAKGNIVDTILRGLQGGQLRLAQEAGKRADVFIHTFPTGARWYRFEEHRKYIEAGRLAAEAQLDELKQLVNAGSQRNQSVTS